MKSPVIRFIGMLSWLITALAAIIIGLKPLGYDIFARPMLATWITPLHYIIGAAGVVSLLMFVMASASSRCACGCHPSTTPPQQRPPSF